MPFPTRRIGLLVLAAPLFLAGCSQHTYYAPPPPPPGMSVGQMGFDNGFNAARRDVETGRAPSYNAHPLYRNPPVPPPARSEYRAAFRDGYQRFLQTGAR